MHACRQQGAASFAASLTVKLEPMNATVKLEVMNATVKLEPMKASV
jgi:hypothetical protein